MCEKVEQVPISALHEILKWSINRPEWQRDAARQFSVSSAYKEQEFPVTIKGARCLLCQQQLDMREAYGWLRATIERIIERVVFCDVVFRFRSYVNLNHLDNVIGFSQAECDELKRLFARCCDVIDAHDAAQGKQAAPPEPKDLKKDIEDTLKLLEGLRARQKQKAISVASPSP